MLKKKAQIIRQSSQKEKHALVQKRNEIHENKAKEPERLRNHLQAFNDGVLAIIITIIVLEIEPPLNGFHYGKFIGNIAIFLISFFVIADFWYDLHLDFSYFILKPNKATVIIDFCLLADLCLLPIMTKWVMIKASTLAVANFGIIFFIARILRTLVQYIGAKASLGKSQIMTVMMTRSSLHRMIWILSLNLFLIVLAFFLPKIVMVLYLMLPILSFIFPLKNRTQQIKQH